jgi:mycofactocin precursor
MHEKGDPMEEKRHEELVTEPQIEMPAILEEVVIEELAVDGICGIY